MKNFTKTVLKLIATRLNSRATLICSVLLLMTGIKAYSQIIVTVSGTAATSPALLPSYTNLANALTAVNAITSYTTPGTIVLTLQAGASETAPVAGFTIGSAALNPLLSSTNTITIVKAGGTVTLNAGVGTSTPGTAIQDGIFKIVGADYVTIDGLTLNDGNAANPQTMEYGFGIFKASATDGAQNNTIQNCNIKLNRINTATGTTPSVEGSKGIMLTSALSTTQTTITAPTVAAGANSNNRFYSNTIQNCNYGIVLIGFAATTPFTLADTNNDVGGSSVGTGNTILNFGGGAAVVTAAVRTLAQYNINISHNTINNNNGSGVNNTSTLRGIYNNTAVSANGTISFNTITLNSAATTSICTAIENVAGSTAAGNTINITNNLIQNCTYSTATSGTMLGIDNSATPQLINISNNTVTNNSLPGTGVMTLIDAGTSTNNQTINNNIVTNNTKTGASGSLFSIRSGTGTVTVNGNTINNNGISAGSGASASIVYGYYNLGAPTSETYTNNIISNLYVVSSTTSSSNIIYGIHSNTTSTSNKVISGNTIHSLNTSGGLAGGTVIGISSSLGTTLNVFKNVIYNLTSGGALGRTFGIANTTNTTINIYNNRVGNLFAPDASSNVLPTLSAGAGINGIMIVSGTAVNVHYNTVYLNASSTGTDFRSAAIYSTNTPVIELRNNIFVNLSTPGATGFTAAYRRSTTDLTNYAAASNNNIFYAGTPSTSRLIFTDGTNNDQTLTQFKARVTPRDISSYTENIAFTSITNGSPDFLKVNTATPSLAESKAGVIGSINDDFDGDTRNATTPDIGSDEFAGTLAVPATINSLTISPNTNQCISTARNITANVTAGLTNITSIQLDYSFNGAAQTPIPMTGGNVNASQTSNWTATIPVAIPSNATVTWSVVVTDDVATVGSVGTTYADEPLTGTVAIANPAAATVCANAETTVTAALNRLNQEVTLGNGVSSITSYNGPFYGLNSNKHMQMLVTAAELNVLGLAPGNINALSFFATSVDAIDFNIDFTIKMANSSATALTAFATETFTQVFTTASYGATVGVNTFNFTTPFNWNGNDNVLIDICFGNSASTALISSTVTGDATSFVSVVKSHLTTASGIGTICPNTSSNVLSYSVRPRMRFFGNTVVPISGISWSDGTTTVGNTNPLIVYPTANTTYTATITALGCIAVSNGAAITTIALDGGPSTAPSSQCGVGVPSVFASGTSNGNYRWYTQPLGGTAIPGETGAGLNSINGGTNTYSISATTTFYVAINSGGPCESERTPVLATVTSPDVIQALVDNNNPCLNDPIQLSVQQTGSTNTYNYTWTANPVPGSGIPTSASGSPVNIIPTLTGTYTYTVAANDDDCNTSSSITVVVKALPIISTITATPNTVCAGSSVTLAAQTFGPGNTSALGTNTGTIGAAAPNPYRTSTSANFQVKTQYLIRALELTTLGLVAGSDINSIAFTTTTAPAGGAFTNFELRIGHTSASAMTTTFLTDPMTPVFTIPSFSPVANQVNTHTFQTPFTWDGISNIVVERRAVNSGSVVTTTVLSNVPSFIPSIDAASATAFAAITGATSTSRPLFTIGYTTEISNSLNWVWEPGTLTGNSVIVNPTSTTTYTVTGTDPLTTCSNTADVLVTVNPIPADPSTTSGDGHCGTAIPIEAVVTSSSGAGNPIFRWYTASTGGSPVQESTLNYLNTAIGITTTYYVSEYSAAGCESNRIAIVILVINPDAIVVNATDITLCLGESADISASYTAVSNDYTSFDLTATGGAASGVTGTVFLTTIGSNPTTGTVPYSVSPTAIGTYTYTVTAFDPASGCTAINSVTIIVGAVPLITNSTASPASICDGATVTLSAVSIPAGAGSVTIGTGATTAASYNAPFYSLWSNKHMQIMVRASELTAAGLVGGNITGLTFYNTAIDGVDFNQNFSIKMAQTAATTMSAFVTSGLSEVYSIPTYIQVVGANAITLNSAFNWDGSSNLVVDICFGNSGSSNTLSSTASTDATSFVSVIKTNTNAATASTTSCPDITTNLLTYSVRPRISFAGQVGVNNTANYNWSWNPGNISAGTTGTVVVTPTTTTTYTARATDPVTGCFTDHTPLTVTVNPLPPAPPTNDPVTRCGPGSVTLLAGTGIETINWYNVPTGGTSLSLGGSFTTSVAVGTTTFYVAETSSFGCEGPRSAVTVTASTPPILIITPVTSTTFCSGGSVVLDANISPTDGSYVNFSWSPATGLSATTGASVTANPTDTIEYTVTANDGVSGPTGCSNTASIIVTVNPNPIISSVTATPATICAGGNSVLEAKSNVGSPLSVKIGTGLLVILVPPIHIGLMRKGREVKIYILLQI